MHAGAMSTIAAAPSYNPSLGQPRHWRITLGYGLAHFGKSLFWYAGELLFAYLLTEASGLSGAAMGLVVSGSLAFSGLLDLLAGRPLTKHLSNLGAAARMQLWGACASTVILLALLGAAWIPGEWQLPYVAATIIAFRTAYLFYDLPQNVMLVTATADQEARSRVSSTRSFFSGSATIAIAAAITPLIAARQSGQLPEVFLALGFAMGAIAITTALLLRWQFDRPGATHATGDGTANPEDRPAFPRPFWLLIAITLILSLTTPTFGKLEPYFATYVLKSSAWGGLLGIAVAGGQVLSQPLWVAFSDRFSRASTLRCALVLIVASGAAFYAVGAENMGAAFAAAALFGCANGGAGMIGWAAAADAIAVVPGRGALGITILTAASKFALASNILAIGLFLSLVEQQSTTSIIWLIAMVCPPMIGAILCWFASLAWSGKSPRRPSRQQMN